MKSENLAVHKLFHKCLQYLFQKSTVHFLHVMYNSKSIKSVTVSMLTACRYT